uniref:B30.2/SPRY domain-containing protein n=1 Tax=Kryptolebias marmoratus TaxID=37003 RepID=A0A3Q3BCU3_KRYMA
MISVLTILSFGSEIQTKLVFLSKTGICFRRRACGWLKAHITSPAHWTSCFAAPVILDPNTAHANLMLSQGLTSVQYSNKAILPDNPERCTSRMCVLGADGFTSGKHRWTVDVGQGKDWFVGVAQESIKRKSAVFFSPVEGFWVIGYCSKDSVWAQNATRARVSVKHYPEKITVELNYDKGRVVFINNADSSVIYTFKEKFSEKLFPYISVGLLEIYNYNNCPFCKRTSSLSML